MTPYYTVRCLVLLPVPLRGGGGDSGTEMKAWLADGMQRDNVLV